MSNFVNSYDVGVLLTALKNANTGIEQLPQAPDFDAAVKKIRSALGYAEGQYDTLINSFSGAYVGEITNYLNKCSANPKPAVDKLATLVAAHSAQQAPQVQAPQVQAQQAPQVQAQQAPQVQAPQAPPLPPQAPQVQAQQAPQAAQVQAQQAPQALQLQIAALQRAIALRHSAAQAGNKQAFAAAQQAASAASSAPSLQAAQAMQQATAAVQQATAAAQQAPSPQAIRLAMAAAAKVIPQHAAAAATPTFMVPRLNDFDHRTKFDFRGPVPTDPTQRSIIWNGVQCKKSTDAKVPGSRNLMTVLTAFVVTHHIRRELKVQTQASERLALSYHIYRDSTMQYMDMPIKNVQQLHDAFAVFMASLQQPFLLTVFVMTSQQKLDVLDVNDYENFTVGKTDGMPMTIFFHRWTHPQGGDQFIWLVPDGVWARITQSVPIWNVQGAEKLPQRIKPVA